MTAIFLYCLALPLFSSHRPLKKLSAYMFRTRHTYTLRVEIGGNKVLPDLIKAALAIVPPCEINLYKNGGIHSGQGVRLRYNNIKKKQITRVQAAIRKCGGLLSLEISKDE